jgi:acyl-CoA synthetase (AMP-forming)/AMP-acid ligase II
MDGANVRGCIGRAMTTFPVGKWKSIPSMIEAATDRFGSRPALIDGETRLTYGELAEQARLFGGALVVSGIEPGDRVAIWAFNSAEWVVAALGLFGAGAVLVPINTRFKGAEAADILLRSRAKVLVTVTDFLGTDYVAMLKDSEVELPDMTTIVIARGSAVAGTDSWGDFLARATEAAGAEVDRRGLALDADDPSDILFTSGTTGFPKGVVQTHGRTLCVATDWVAMTGLNADDRYLMMNPYFHMFGLKGGILAAACAGATMLPQAVFDPEIVLSVVTEEGVTVLPGPPTLYQGILDHPQRDHYDLSTLRVAVTGAADIPVELIRRLDSEMPFSLIITGYGLTETGTASSTLPGDDVETIATTVGCARPGFELRIVDGEGSEVAPGAAGEIVLRGGSIMSHYLDDPVATTQALSADGWLRTGDIGTVDSSGYLRIVGRSKDMFIVGGFNAYPAEIENFLLLHPDIRQAAVIGIPDDRLGEVGMAFVVMKPGVVGTEADIIGWSRVRMANFKVPRVVEFVDDLPLNATGKVVKDVLRERVAQRACGASA